MKDDNSLVQRVLEGDSVVFREIVERHQTRIFYLGLKFFRNSEDAEDFAQEVFLRAYQKLNTFSGKVPFYSWLYRLAYNLAINQYHVNRKRLLEVAIVEPAPGNNPTPETSFLEKEFIEKVRGVLRKLPQMYHIVLKMHFFEGLSYPQISKIINVPVNTIKSYIFRAKKIIKERLIPYTKE